MLKRLKIKNKHTLPFLIIFVVLIFTFWQISNIFFQQDEWLGLGNAFTYRARNGLFSLLKASFLPNYALSRYLPFTGIINYLVFNTFQKNASLYGFLGLFMALVNSGLLYLMAYRLTKSRIVGIFTALLWVTNNLALQSITWIGTMLPSQFAMLFFLLGFNNLTLFLESKNRKKLFLFVVFLMTSVFIKEQGIYYLAPVFLLVFFWDESKKNDLGEKINNFLRTALPAILFLILPRILNILRGYTVNVSPSQEPSSFGNIIFNIFLLPARSIAHIFVSPGTLYKYIYLASQTHYSQITDGSVIETMGGDIFSLLVSFYIICGLFFMSLVFKARQKKFVVICLTSFFASTIPFVLYKNTNAILEPRYYTHLALWGSLLVVFCFYSFFSNIKRLGKFWAVLFLLLLLINNILGVKKVLGDDIKTGNYRKNILKTVSQSESYLAEDNIFYFFTDGGGFYEFQSGFGQTLAVWFFDTGKIPKGVLQDQDFWDPSYEGVKDYQGNKYGYFMDYDKMVRSLQEAELKEDSVIAFYWDTQKRNVTNVTKKIREKLSKDLKDD